MKHAPPVVEELLRSPYPTAAYKTRRLLLGEDEDSGRMRGLRQSIRASGMARLLSHRTAEGVIHTNPYKKWQGPHWTLYCLAQAEWPPGDASLLPLRDQVYDWLLEEKHLRFPRSLLIPGQENRFRHCATMEGNAVWYSMRLGMEDDRTRELVERLIRWQWPDGGWNCDKRPEARTSSVIESLIPMRALFLWGRKHRHSAAVKAAEKTAGYFLARRLFRRKSDGGIILPLFEKIQYPIQFYDVLFILKVMAEAGKLGDERCRDALDLLQSKMRPDGGFPLERMNCVVSDAFVTRGSFADWGRAGKSAMNPFVTAEALWVLKKAGRI
jgi:hypothetical protein